MPPPRYFHRQLSKKTKATNPTILVVNPNIYNVYSMLKQYTKLFKKNCIIQHCAVLWNAVWVLYVRLKHIAQKSRNSKDVEDMKTFPYKEDDCKD